ncbi:hypothetical protein Taro_009776 [Colocasia esculenta]|uniref:Uncharacterized protein n=1 Tax=Colocasia esculenta TaxID=4460 RepID=A0A843U168_COLES|nr:hypothetical protein [Colocasia esculenta]
MATLSAPPMEVAKVVNPNIAPPMAKQITQKASTSISFPGSAKYQRVGAVRGQTFDVYQVLRYPIMTEYAVGMMEKDNTLAFVVDARADKKMIRGALKGLLGVEAKRVNTLVRPDGSKKAYVKLAPGYVAADVANRIGMF